MQFGCCLSNPLQISQCINLPECNLQTSSAIKDINIDGSCSFDGFGCVQCLARDNAKIRYCQQLFIYLSETTVNH